MGTVAESYMSMGNAQIFSHIWGGRKSYMTLQPLPSGFPYIWGKFCFLFHQCNNCQVSSFLRFFFTVSSFCPRHCKEPNTEKFKTNIPRKGIAWPQSQLPHSCSNNFELVILDQSRVKMDKKNMMSEISRHCYCKWGRKYQTVKETDVAYLSDSF